MIDSDGTDDHLHPRTLDGLPRLRPSLGVVQRYGGPHVAVAGPEQGGAERPVDGGGAVRDARTGVREDRRTVEGNGGEVVPEVGVRRGDADGLPGFHGKARRGGAEDRREDAAADASGLRLLELEEGLVLF
ncbi:hypothetical protein EYF80_040926 [Liparis tanakae]|uniref:Uncharacterized protein n=1 Tax=Liparis tanakae TaxID=230148 RepID=A0A4Z2G6U9_9TELE|nr:hypothetical protein EYF80_040926 [Liparis tanakae]